MDKKTINFKKAKNQYTLQIQKQKSSTKSWPINSVYSVAQLCSTQPPNGITKKIKT